MDLSTILLLVGGGYVLYEFFLNPATQVASTTTTNATSTGNTTNTTQATTTNTQSSSGNSSTPSAYANQTLQSLVNLMTASGENPNGYQTVDVWNYYYQKVRGIAPPAPEVLFPNNPRDQKYALGEWWTAATANGLSGIGTIVRANPYQNPVQGLYFGSNLRARGAEKANIVKGV